MERNGLKKNCEKLVIGKNTYFRFVHCLHAMHQGWLVLDQYLFP